jgi:hypothetical protein
VRPSGQDQKRAFLTSKGLTEGEIAEAFRRVPDAAGDSGGSGVSSGAVASAPQAGAPATYPPAPGAGLAAARAPPLTWSQVLFRVGLYAGSALAAKRALAPYAQPAARSLAAYCGYVPSSDDVEAAVEKERLASVGAVLESKTEELASSLEDVKALLRRVERDVARTPGTPAGPGATAAEVSTATVQALTPAIKDALRDIRDELRAEMRAMSERTQAAAAAPSGGANAATPQRGQEEWRFGDGDAAVSAGVTRQLLAHQPSPAGLARSMEPRDAGYSPGYSSSWETAASAGPGPARGSQAPQPHRGSRDQADGGGASNGSSSGGGVGALPPPRNVPGAAAGAASSGGDAPVVGLHPASYMSLLDMVESGRTPPGIREVDDKAPDNGAPPTAPTMRPPTKPWERGSTASVPHYSQAATRQGGVVLTELAGEGGGYGTPSAGAGPSSAGGWTPPTMPAFADDAAARVVLGAQPGGGAPVEQADA